MIKFKFVKYSIILSLAMLLACSDDETNRDIPYVEDPVIPSVEMTTDKAVYNPGETVLFTADKLYTNAFIRYKHLGTVVGELPLTATTWSWTPPLTDFKGYMAEVYVNNNDGTTQILGTVAVDVSSDWSKFPRYGFLSDFGVLTASQKQEVIANLKKYHINGLQFYDWLYRHHAPLAGTVNSPMPVWNDIINRDNYLSTVQDYITLAHESNMKTMFYNLAYGVLNDYDPALIPPQLFIYKDINHTMKDRHELSAPFISDIYLVNPANAQWQNYLIQKNDEVYQVFDFDGFHIDQLGDRGTVYRYDGSDANLKNTFPAFIESMKQAHPDKRMVMNAVNQYGQPEMAGSNLDFLYTEVWSPNEGFKDLTNILADNAAYSNHTKNTVLAAYMNYNKANSPGIFNTPGILLTDAVIFAFGGSHLELGEHMLAKEYFPNTNLSMTVELKTTLLEYYDFLTAYQNLLRDGGSFNTPVLSSGDGKMNLGSWPPTMGKVAVVGKQVGAKQVVHLLNFTNANSLNWRDTEGTQRVPEAIKQAMLNLQVSGTVTKIWYASPDYNGGSTIAIDFTQVGSSVNLKVPFLKYWGMIVVE